MGINQYISGTGEPYPPSFPPTSFLTNILYVLVAKDWLQRLKYLPCWEHWVTFSNWTAIANTSLKIIVVSGLLKFSFFQWPGTPNNMHFLRFYLPFKLAPLLHCLSINLISVFILAVCLLVKSSHIIGKAGVSYKPVKTN